MKKITLFGLALALCFSTSLWGNTLEKDQFIQLMKDRATLELFQEDLDKLLDLIEDYIFEVNEHYERYIAAYPQEDLKKEGYLAYIEYIRKYEIHLDRQFIIKAIPFVFFGCFSDQEVFQERDQYRINEFIDLNLENRWQEYAKVSKFKSIKSDERDSSMEEIRALSQQFASQDDFFKKLLKSLEGCNNKYDFFLNVLGNLEFFKDIKYLPEQKEQEVEKLYKWSQKLYEINCLYHKDLRNLIYNSFLSLFIPI